MRPQRHIIASTFSGIAIWVAGRNLPAGIILFFGGVMPEIDHVFEFIIHNGMRGITIEKIYKAFSVKNEVPFKKLYFFGHSIELAILLWIALFFSRIFI